MEPNRLISFSLLRACFRVSPLKYLGGHGFFSFSFVLLVGRDILFYTYKKVETVSPFLYYKNLFCENRCFPFSLYKVHFKHRGIK
jgi:hypothetical protein